MLNLVRIWIFLSAGMVASGWFLSSIHQLNRGGYLVCATLSVAATFFFIRGTVQRPQPIRLHLHKLRRRFLKPAPFLFLMLVVMSFVSGVIWPPYNSDSFSYRIPRVLHWLGQEHWHWIHTADARMNVAACNYEWFMSPLILFTNSDRLLFLINWIPFLLLPGLSFSLFKSLGIGSRPAWWWSWILPAGWCFVMQAASVTNDAFATAYGLAAVVFALRCRKHDSRLDFWISTLAMALMTGVKQTNIPLAVLWAVAIWPRWQIILRKPLITFFGLILVGLVSAAPITIFNYQHTGSWSGLPAVAAENPEWHIQLDSAFWGIIGNTFSLPVQNLVPPFFPWNTAWNAAMKAFVNTPFGSHFASFEGFGTVSPGVSESSAGIGLAVSVLIIVSVSIARRYRHHSSASHYSPVQLALLVLPWLLLLLFMAEDGAYQTARHLSAYYIFLLPLLFAGRGNEQLVNQSWWQKLAYLCLLSSVILLIINPNRPLFPAMSLANHIQAKHPGSRALSLLQGIYGTPDSFRQAGDRLRHALPQNENLIGFAGAGNATLEPALWLPLGHLRVERITSHDTPKEITERGIRYVVIEESPSFDCRNIDDWLNRYHAEILSDLPFEKGGHRNHLSHVYITRLNPF